MGHAYACQRCPCGSEEQQHQQHVYDAGMQSSVCADDKSQQRASGHSCRHSSGHANDIQAVRLTRSCEVGGEDLQSIVYRKRRSCEVGEICGDIACENRSLPQDGVQYRGRQLIERSESFGTFDSVGNTETLQVELAQREVAKPLVELARCEITQVPMTLGTGGNDIAFLDLNGTMQQVYLEVNGAMLQFFADPPEVRPTHDRPIQWLDLRRIHGVVRCFQPNVHGAVHVLSMHLRTGSLKIHFDSIAAAKAWQHRVRAHIYQEEYNEHVNREGSHHAERRKSLYKIWLNEVENNRQKASVSHSEVEQRHLLCAENLFRLADLNNDGKVTFAELCTLCKWLYEIRAQHIKEQIKHSRDHGGFLLAVHGDELLQRYAQYLESGSFYKSMIELLESCDARHDGSLDANDFKKVGKRLLRDVDLELEAKVMQYCV